MSKPVLSMEELKNYLTDELVGTILHTRISRMMEESDDQLRRRLKVHLVRCSGTEAEKRLMRLLHEDT